MSSPPSLSNTPSVQNTITPVPIPAPKPQQIPIPPELLEAIEKFNRQDPTLIKSLCNLVDTQKRIGIQYSQKGILISDLPITLNLPLSWFTTYNGVLAFSDHSQTKPLPITDHDKVNKIKTIDEAEKLFQKNEINVQEYRSAITDIGTVQGEKSIRFWVPSEDMRPGLEGNNKSRNGFLRDCNSNILGAFYQGVVKKAIISAIYMAKHWKKSKKAVIAAINFAHSKWQKQYDKNAFVYDDPMLRFLNTFLKDYIDNHIPDTANYKKYHLELYGKVIDLVLGTAKEDVIHRVMFKDMINTFCGKVVFPMTYEEQTHFDLWCHR